MQLLEWGVLTGARGLRWASPARPSPPPARVTMSPCVAWASGHRSISCRLALRVISVLELTANSQRLPWRGILSWVHRHLSSAGGARGQPETEFSSEKWPDPVEARKWGKEGKDDFGRQATSRKPSPAHYWYTSCQRWASDPREPTRLSDPAKGRRQGGGSHRRSPVGARGQTPQVFLCPAYNSGYLGTKPILPVSAPYEK